MKTIEYQFWKHSTRFEWTQTPNPVAYYWDLAGSQGAYFILFTTEDHSPNDVTKAKAWLRDTRDVVSIRIAGDDVKDCFYRTEMFRHPATRPLAWYQINADDLSLIRKCRESGMSIDDYVNKYVLPCIAETEAKNFAKHGNTIHTF